MNNLHFLSPCRDNSALNMLVGKEKVNHEHVSILCSTQVGSQLVRLVCVSAIYTVKSFQVAGHHMTSVNNISIEKPTYIPR